MSRAGDVVSGALEATGEGLRYRVRLVDALHRQLIPGPDPVPVSPEAPTDDLVELGASMAACLAPVLTERPVRAQRADRPPSFAAYRAYLAGLDHFIRADWGQALEEFRTSWAEEERYALPRIVSVMAHWNMGELPEAGRDRSSPEA